MEMTPQFESISIKFRDIPDGVNQRQCTRTFTTRLFTKGDTNDEMSALEELGRSARKHGFTTKEIIKVRRRQVDFLEIDKSTTKEHL